MAGMRYIAFMTARMKCLEIEQASSSDSLRRCWNIWAKRPANSSASCGLSFLIRCIITSTPQRIFTLRCFMD